MSVVEYYADPPRPLRHGLTVTFEHVCYTVTLSKKFRVATPKSHLEILKGVTGEFTPGEMCAIMGPSGSGKTTFLDVLAGRKTQGQLHGTILYGASKPSRQLLRRYVGYVEQHDTLVDTMTVFEMLMYTAALKRPISEKKAVKKEVVESLISKLSLESCRDTRIGSAMSRGISGGQAKRTNVALALITDAKVLLLDEPTSGLDSTTANEVMQVVKSLCKDGTTIAATVHSPSSFCFGLFDRLLVLVAGRTVYFGSPGQQLISYLVGQCGARQPTIGDNLAEWLMDFAMAEQRRPDGADSLADVYEGSHLAKETATSVSDTIWHERERLPRSTLLRNAQAVSLVGEQQGWLERVTGSSAYATPAWWTLKTLITHRTLRNYRSWTYIVPRVADKVAFALLLAVLYWGLGKDFTIGNIPNLAGLLYLCITAPISYAFTLLAPLIADRTLFIREQHDGMYRPTVYFVWKMFDEMTLQMAVSWGIHAIMFYGCKLQGSFLYFHILMCSALLNSMTIACTVVCLSRSIEAAAASIGCVIMVLSMVNGFLIRTKSIPVFLRWFVKLNLMHYLWGGLMINQFDTGKKDGSHSGPTSIGGTKVLDYYDLTGYDKWEFLVMPFVHFGVMAVISWTVLVYVKHQRR